MSGAGESEHPASGARHERGREPAHPGIDTSGRLIKAGVALFAIGFIGYGLWLLWLIALACVGACGPFYLIPIVPIIPGLFAIWAGRGALRGTRSGLIGVALCGGVTVAVALLGGIGPGALGVRAVWAIACGLIGFMLLAGVAGRLASVAG